MREKIVRPVTFVLILVLGWMLYRAFIVPKRQGFTSLRKSLKQMEFQMNKLLGEEVALRGGAMEKEALERELERLILKIPSERDIPRIINQLISQVGKGLKIEYTLIEPKEIKGEGKYKKAPLELNFFTSYKDFNIYLSQLKKLSAATRVESLGLRRLPEEKDKLEVHMLLSAFVMPSDEEPIFERVSPEAMPKFPLVSPFTPKETTRTAAPTAKEEKPAEEEKGPTFVLQGVFGGERLGAIINDTMVYPGDQIEGYTVVSVQQSGVVLKRGTKRLNLRVP